MTLRVELRPAAERDLDRLVVFMAKLDERAADRRERWLRESIRKLGDRPLMGRPGPRSSLRERVLKYGRSSYLVRYRVTDEALVVLRIWHGKEDR
ncbi:MAG: type II toxin-antitoxin system RelE/ParE family toxin [Alphaproteobacteria bacterium]|nr:MAG: type II toxin-antitoxin system RelE/ParE family toxin [Alphaproteobacteria bacterium]